MKRATNPPQVRWRPAVVILALAVLGVAGIYLGTDQIRQVKFQSSAAVVFVAFLLLVVWMGFFSGLPGRVRLLALAALLGLGVAFFSLFRYRGITGDFVPLFEPRWQAASETGPGRGRLDLTSAYDYPQFLGPQRDGRVEDLRLARDWSARPPRLIWRRPVGEGWSAFAVVGDTAVTQEQHGGEERVVSYDLATGEVQWIHSDPVGYLSPIAGNGPRSTPTLSQGRVYTLGATGVLNCLDLETGERIWSRDVLRENQATNLQWGRSTSPLVVEDRVVVSAGGPGGRSLVAYHRQTGEVVWQEGSDLASYSSPLVATLAGVRQIVVLNQASVTGHDLEQGRLLWAHPWPSGQPSVTQPLVLPGDRLLVSAGYGVGSQLLHIKARGNGRLEAELLWKSSRLKAKFTNLIYHDGFVYGLDDGILVCLDPETGERCWKRGRYGHGQVILVGDLLLVQTEGGEVVLVEPTPEELVELGRFEVMERKVWNPPALAGPYLLVRNDRQAALFELPLDG